jgi:hypothetical protein
MTADVTARSAALAEPMRRRRHSALAAQLCALASQAGGALQLLLLLRAGTSRSTDAYFLCFAAGQLVTSIWVLGVVYPRHLADPSRSWAGVTARAMWTAAGLVLVATGYALTIGYSWRTLLGISLPLVVAATAAAAATTYAAALGCSGRPLPLAGVALPANAAACLGLATAVLTRPSLAGPFMCIGLAAGNVLLAVGLRRRAEPIMSVVATPAGGRPKAPSGDKWLLVGSIAGGLSPVLFQALVASFPKGELTEFGVVTRLGLALTTVGLNAMLPLMLSWRYVATVRLRQLTWAGVLMSVPAAVLVRVAVGRDVLGTSLDGSVLAALVAWALLCPSTNIAARLVVLRNDFRVFRWTAAANLTLTAAAGAVAVARHDLLPVALGYLSVEAAVTGLLLYVIGWRVATVAIAVATVTILFACSLSNGPALAVGALGSVVVIILSRNASRETTGRTDAVFVPTG